MRINDVISGLQRIYSERMSLATGGVASVAWLDFPDYSNVGDSAIWLGQVVWSSDAGLSSDLVIPERALTDRLLQSVSQRPSLPIITGGGNMGGLYPSHDLSRRRILRAYADRAVIQAPQSVHFTSDLDRALLLRDYNAHSNFIVFVRDLESKQSLESLSSVDLVPDAAHMLGMFDVPKARRRVCYLLRTDHESASSSGKTSSSELDWLGEASLPRRVRQVRADLAGSTGMLWPIAGINYLECAERRLSRGLKQVSVGEVLITDRLHAMILGLQCGRKVVAVDNAVRKLSRYASMWFADLDEGTLVFAKDRESASRLADSF